MSSGTQRSPLTVDVSRGDRWPPYAWLALRFLGALAVLAIGAVHLEQYLYLYSAIPTIGPLFLLNVAAATVLGLALLAPSDRLGQAWHGLLTPLVALAGVGLAAGTFVFLLISEHTPLFGFREPGYDPTAITASRIADVAAVVLLGAYLVARYVARFAVRRW